MSDAMQAPPDWRERLQRESEVKAAERAVVSAAEQWFAIHEALDAEPPHAEWLRLCSRGDAAFNALRDSVRALLSLRGEDA